MVKLCFVCATECWRAWIGNKYRDQLAVESYGFSFRQEQQSRSDMYFSTPNKYGGSLSGDRGVDRKVGHPLPTRPKLRTCIYYLHIPHAFTMSYPVTGITFSLYRKLQRFAAQF